MRTLAMPLVLAVGLGACSVGKGVGAASGHIYEYGCSTESGDYCFSPDVCGTAASPAPYDLEPSYFAAEPIDDLRNYGPGSEPMNNRLTIRLQRSGKQIELNDVLTFDVASSYEVARCVRGRVDPSTGGNDWDEANCYRASDTGPGRMRVQYDSDVHGALTLKATCTANLVASAISARVPLSYAAATPSSVANGAWDSWVEFQEFGDAAQADRPPQERDPVSPKFRVDFGQRIYATSFFVTLIDDNVVTAAINGRPRPDPQIGGTLGGDPTTGRFDFDLERGQGAQFFP
ncbi:MAG: hypothetical protein JXP73_10385 [Deltaproteobacteria bacterium]|nr:hypothetical protein [Deltaproteobacteria bacterium]